MPFGEVAILLRVKTLWGKAFLLYMILVVYLVIVKFSSALYRQ
jgi:hypothetical protein